MNLNSVPTTHCRRSLLKAIVIGGAIAGSLDLVAAFITFGWGVPRAIAAGLLGLDALHGGTAIWIFGVFLHYFIAYSAATVYCFSSVRLDFLKPHFIVCGMFYGIAVFLVMTLIVLPLCGLHANGPFHLDALLRGLVMHMLIIGLPIACSLQVFSQ